MKRLVLLLLPLAGCVPRPTTVPTPLAQPRPTVRPVAPVVPPPVAWEDRARTAGDWSYSASVGETAAVFRGSDQALLVAVVCLPTQRQVRLELRGPAGPITVRTTSLSRVLPAVAVGPVGRASLPAADPLLDAIVYSRGKVLMQLRGQAELIVPPWPELNRVVDDCRG